MVGGRHERRGEVDRIGGEHGARGDFARAVNTSDNERIGSAVAGGALLALGLMPRSLTLIALGAGLTYRGITGHCHLYGMLGVDRRDRESAPVHGNLGIKVDRAVRVQAPPDRVYAVWRNFENLPRVMSHLERVEVFDRTRSRWTVSAPGGAKLSWDAEIINEKPNELIAWRSIDHPVVEHAGSVNFERAPDGQSTIVRVSLQYDPPAGEVGHAIARLFSSDPATQIEQDLAGFKRAMEAGELAA